MTIEGRGGTQYHGLTDEQSRAELQRILDRLGALNLPSRPRPEAPAFPERRDVVNVTAPRPARTQGVMWSDSGTIERMEDDAIPPE